MEPLPYQDYTRKARLYKPGAVRETLAQLGARLAGTDLQLDTYFACGRGKLKWRLGTLENLITQYERVMDQGYERTTVYRYECDPSPEAIRELIRAHAVVAQIRKLRLIWFWNSCKVHVDQLPSGECFLEVEAIDATLSRPAAELKKACDDVFRQLDIPRHDWMSTGYAAV